MCISLEVFSNMNTNDKLTLIVFKAPWCVPCTSMKPIIDKAMDEHDDINLVSVNVDEDTELAVEYQVRHIPTLLLVKDNSEVNRLVGSHSAKQIEEFISSQS